MSRVVVTGGAGLIGSHLIRRLLDRGRQVVVVVDNFSRGTRRNLADLRNFSKAARAIRGAATVYHLAAVIGSVEYLR